jgi:drug/metabolite transporter (DMT)-like permease
MAPTSLLLAVLAAGCNALSSVMQRKANRDEPEDRPFGIALLGHLLTRPAWLLGFVAMLASFLLQAAALDQGELSAVEPVLALELPLTLMLASVVFRRRMNRRDWISSVAMAVGLAIFISVLAPSDGDAAAFSGSLAVLATAATVAGIAGTAVLAQLGALRARAALFGVAAGSGFGLTASLIKVSVTRLSNSGASGLFSAWETYGVAVAGVSSVVLVQAALHAGTLVAAQPGITLLDPLVSLLWGTVVFDESTRTGPILLLAAAGAVLIIVAALGLARSALHRETDPARG